MDASDSEPRIPDAVEASLCHDPDVEFVVLFGSQLTDDSRPSSDIDLAVKFTDSLSSHDRFQKRCFLTGDIQLDGIPFIDVSDIQELPLDVAHDAVQGEFICGDKSSLRQFKSDVETRFAEQHDVIRRQQQAVIDRIAEDGLRG
jgi:predicted nucleotidyltransferase